MKNKTMVMRVVYLAIVTIVATIIFYVINNYLLARIGFSMVGWANAFVFAIILIILYELILPIIQKHKKHK